MIGEISWHKGEYEPWLGGSSGGGMNMMSCKNVMYPFRSRFYNPSQTYDRNYPAATDICNTSSARCTPAGATSPGRTGACSSTARKSASTSSSRSPRATAARCSTRPPTSDEAAGSVEGRAA